MGDFDAGFRDVEMLSQSFNKSRICLTVVSFGAKVNSKLLVAGLNNLFLTSAGFNRNHIFH